MIPDPSELSARDLLTDLKNEIPDNLYFPESLYYLFDKILLRLAQQEDKLTKQEDLIADLKDSLRHLQNRLNYHRH